MCRADRYITGAVLIAVLALAGCSDIYFDRRETVSFHAGDAPATNAISQTIDPWPPEAGNRRITYNGERMQKAAERYRTNKTTPLNTSSTSSVQYQGIPTVAPPAAGGTP